MATLSNPTLKIDPLTGTTYRVTAKVTVQFTPQELSWINPGSGRPGLGVKLKSTLLGDDSDDRDREGGDDTLLLFPTANITRSATYTFSKVVSGRILNEDIGLRNQDEIYNAFSLVSESPGLISNKTRNSPIIRAFYGSSGV
jgi:hypothetical protein